MANFTETELESAVSKFVRNEVKTERTDLGPLSTGYTFEEVQEFVASTLVFDPSAVFYLLSLAANRVNQDVTQALEYLDDIIVAIDEVGRDTTKVTQTSLLEDAAAALLEVERTIETKNAITERPFNRYTQALDTFTSKSLTPNVRRLGPGTGLGDTYEIVRPPQKAQSSIKTNIAELRDLHEVIIEEATQLTVAMSEFLAANLPLVSIQTSLPKIRNDLRSWKSQLDAASKDGAIEITRDVFLSINAGRSVVTNLTSISDPREERMKSSSTSSDRAAAYSDATYPAAESTPAELTTTISAPYRTTPTANEVKLEVDGGVEQTATLPEATQASISGSRDENYDIFLVDAAAEMTSGSAGPYTVPAAPDNVFEIYADGVGYSAILTSGSRTAAQVAAEIDAATRIDGSPGTFSVVGTASDDAGSLKLAHDTAGDHVLTLGDALALNTALGFTNEQSAEGETANNQLRLIVDDDNTVVLSLSTAGSRTAAQVAAELDASSSLVNVTTEVVTTSTGSITVIKITSAEYGEYSHLKVESSTTAQEELVETLGLAEDQDDRGSFVLLEHFDQAIQAQISGVETDQSRTVKASGNGGTAVKAGAAYYLSLPSGTLSGLGISTTDTLRISNGENLGWYNINGLSIGGADDRVYVDRPLPATTGAEAQNQEWSIVHDVLIIRSLVSDTTSKLKVNSASAYLVVGMSLATHLGTVSGVRIKEGAKFLNFSREDVVAGDVLTLRGPTYTTQHTVSSVTYDGYQIEVTPQVKNDLAGHEYTIESEGALAYDVFYEDLTDWFTSTLSPSKYDEDILAFERTLNPLLVNKNPSAALVGTADTEAQTLRNIYSTLSSLLADFTTSVVPRIDALLDMLQERGMDRAHDLLLLGEFSEFFGVTKDGSSYGGNLLEKLRSIAQNDVPQGRSQSSDNADDRLEGSYNETDAEYDFSDQDEETGVREIDNLPDLAEDEDVLNRSL
jgi:hypothetical protein